LHNIRVAGVLRKQYNAGMIRGGYSVDAVSVAECAPCHEAVIFGRILQDNYVIPPAKRTDQQ